jgi:hypothetical protein
MKFYGLDTETLEGKARIIATNEEYQAVNNFSDIIDFLMQKKYRGCIFWTWNLRYDVQAILKHHLQENKEDWRTITDLIMKKRTGEDKPETYSFLDAKGRYIKMFYIQSKLLNITINKHTIKLYDIAQFYGHEKLENASQKYLKTGKNDYANWVQMCKDYSAGTYTLNEMEKYLKDNQEDIGKYCKLDAELTLKLSVFMKEGFENANIPFEKPLSQAKIAENYMNTFVSYPLVPDKLNNHHELARRTFHGGIFETVQRGYFQEEIFDYDINSAYPEVMAGLPHWGNGQFYLTEGYTDGIKYGWYLAEFDCRYIPYEDTKKPYQLTFDYEGEEETVTASNYRMLYPVGKRFQFVTRAEVDFMIKNNYYCKVLQGVEWKQTKDKYKSPFHWVEPTYYKRSEIKKVNKDDMRQYALKILLNSTYGKTAQQKPFRSSLTNFFYASYITAGTRVKIAQVAHDNSKHVIDIATDGICLNKEVKGIEINEEKLGAWKPAIFKEALFIGSGIRQMFYTKPDKNGNTYETYARGLTNDRNFNLLGAIEENKEHDIIRSIKNRPLNMGECRQHTKILDIEDLNVFKTVEKKLNVNTDKKHIWTKDYSNFGEFLQVKSKGKPFNVNDL